MRRRLPLALRALPIAGLVALLIARIFDEPVERYGDSAAGWIEHQARLLAAARLERADGGLRAALRATDGLYPPGLHLLAIGLGALLGPSAQVAGLIGPAALLLYAASVGDVARSLGAKTTSAALFCMFTPALHGMATRYYYDLPMAALVWCAAAACLRARHSRGAALAAAGLAIAAAGMKWSAAPLGMPLLVVAAARADRPRAWAGPIALLMSLPLGAALGLDSLGAMSAVSFQPPPGADLNPGLAAVPILGGALSAMLAQAGALSPERLTFYPERLIDSVYGPLGAAVLTLSALRAPRLGALGTLPTLTTAGFLLLLLPPLDERFLVVWLGLPAVLAGLGAERWARSLGRAAPVAGAAALAIGIGLAADLHAPGRHAPAGDADLPPEAQGRAPFPGWGAGSSVDRRGWSRTEHRPPPRDALGERLRQDIIENNLHQVIVADQLRLSEGERNWWGALQLERAAAGQALEVSVLTEPPVPRPPAGARLYLPVVGGPQRPRTALGEPAAAGWAPCPRPILSDPEGGPGIEAWCSPQGAP